MDNNHSNSLPKWIKKIQQQSWQIEILIASGLIIFLFNLPQFLLTQFMEYEESVISRAEPVILFFGAYIFSRALLLGFIATLFLRALWLAFLGINFAFPNGIDFRRLSYNDYFVKKISKTKSIPERIISLERICSLTYSVTIMVTLLTAGIFVFIAILFYAMYYLAPQSLYTPEIGIILLIIIFFLMLGVTDWLFFGKLKNFNLVSKLYYPVYKLYQWLTFSFLYQKEYLTFISNVNRWKVYGIFLIYFLLAFEISMIELSKSKIGPSYLVLINFDQRNFTHLPTFLSTSKNKYENMLGENDKIISSAIQSDIITGNFLKVFIVYTKYFDESLDSLFRKNNVKLLIKNKTVDNYKMNDTLIQKSLDEFFVLKIDGKKVEKNNWFLHKHFKTDEMGFVSYIPIFDLPEGKHILMISMNILQKGVFVEKIKSVIPFFRD